MSDKTPQDFRELERLFEQALGMSPREREKLLERLRVESPTLADRLAAMLDSRTADFLKIDAALSDTARQVVEDADPLIGERFGAYRAQRLLGRGGMGAVYEGVRVDEEFQQRVAIKTIRLGRESPEFLERFRREREILARLNHSGIARLLDGGTGPRGIPYVVMEFVTGTSLLQYAREQKARLERLLELFLELADAIHFVHRNLIVHRDIKPGNVMVDGEGKIKLLDFGIAKLIEEFEGETPATATVARMMTPEYASPEQILGQPVTTSADVYALGVLLYELLTGCRPVEYDTGSPYAIAEAIVSRTPTLPSQAGPSGPSRFSRQLRGDLDRIVMMALRKEPERRYPSVAAFAEDVRNFIAGRPVTAQVDSWHYRAKKFLQRHPLATGATALAVAVILGFTALTIRQSGRIADERDRALEAEDQAQLEARVAEASKDFLMRLFRTADPRNAGTQQVTARDLLDAGIQQLDSDEGLDPRVRVEMLLTLGLGLANLEEYESAVRALRASVAERRELFGAESLEHAEGLHRLGDVLRRTNDSEEAYALLTQALEIRERLLVGDSYELADSYNNIAILALNMGRFAESKRLQAESIAMHERVSGPDSPALTSPLLNMGLLKRRLGELKGSLEFAKRGQGVVAEDQTFSLLNLRLLETRLIRELGNPEESIPRFEELFSAYAEYLDPDATRLASIRREIGQSLQLMGRYEEAARIYERLEDRTPPDTTGYGILQLHRGRLQLEMGHLEAAERLLRDALRINVETAGAEHFRIARLRRNLADALIALGRFDDAESELLQGLKVLPEPADVHHVEVGRIQTRLARIYRTTNRPDEARRAVTAARATLAATIGEESIEMGRLLVEEGLLARDGGDGAGGARLLESAARLLEERLPEQHPANRELRRLLLPPDST